MITMEPKTPEHKLRDTYQTFLAMMEDSPSMFRIAAAAAMLRTELNADNDDCIALAQHLDTMLSTLDDARFSLYDLTDAVINHTETPGCKELNRLWNLHQDDPRPWERLILIMAENKRSVYYDETPDYNKFRKARAACRGA